MVAALAVVAGIGLVAGGALIVGVLFGMAVHARLAGPAESREDAAWLIDNEGDS